MIQIKGINKFYRKKQALKDLDLELQTGHITGLIGPNGSGKTTLLRILGSFDQAYTGEVSIDGHAPGPEARALTSYLPDEPVMPDWMPAEQMIQTYGTFFGDFDERKAFDMLQFFKLDRKQPLKEMSKGMKEKMQILLTMSRQAKVYLLDEPISGVDPAARKTILRGIISNYSDDALMILSTHLLQDVEPVLDEVIFLQDGQIRLRGYCDALRAEHGVSLNELFEEMYQ